DLGHVAVRVEDRNERRVLAGPEYLQRPLVRLVGRVAGDRELLEPPLRDRVRRVGADQCQCQPEKHDRAPAAKHETGKRGHKSRTIWIRNESAQGRYSGCMSPMQLFIPPVARVSSEAWR